MPPDQRRDYRHAQRMQKAHGHCPAVGADARHRRNVIRLGKLGRMLSRALFTLAHFPVRVSRRWQPLWRQQCAGIRRASVGAPKDAHRGTQIPKRHAITATASLAAARHAVSNQTSNAVQRINSGGMRVGIDFGTTHTVAAIVDRGNYPVVYFDGDGHVAIARRCERRWRVALRSGRRRRPPVSRVVGPAVLQASAQQRRAPDRGDAGRAYPPVGRSSDGLPRSAEERPSSVARTSDWSRASASRPRSAFRPMPRAPNAF